MIHEHVYICNSNQDLFSEDYQKLKIKKGFSAADKANHINLGDKRKKKEKER